MANEKYGIITIEDNDHGIRLPNAPMAIIEIVSEEESQRIMLKTGLGRKLLTPAEAEEIQKVLDKKVPYCLNYSHSTALCGKARENL